MFSQQTVELRFTLQLSFVVRCLHLVEAKQSYNRHPNG